MRLSKISLSGFKCYGSIVEVPIYSLTIIIGENDSGKSTIVRALGLMLSNSGIIADDFYKSEDGETAPEIEIAAEFIVANGEVPGDISVNIDEINTLRIKKTYTLTNLRGNCSIYREIYADNRFNNYLSLGANDLKAFVRDLELQPRQTKAENIAIIDKYLEESEQTREFGWQNIQFADIEDLLPRLETISSTDYRDPSYMVQASIQSSIQSKIKEVEKDDHPIHQAFKSFQEWAENEIDSEANAIPNYVKDSLPSLRDIKINTKIDLAKSVSVSRVALDLGKGMHPIDSFGEGTRKKLWMSLMEWRQQSQDETQLARPIIRVYDEPDLNLDYAAEKKLFEYISNSSRVEGSRVQNILCTHSVTLVDRALAESINLIKVLDDNSREIQYMNTYQGQDRETTIKEFFNQIGGQLQVRNTELFYEKGYLVFEGETEQELLPILYQKLYGRSMSDDGIVLLNMHTCGNWRTPLEFLGANRVTRTVLLLDKDASLPESSSRITEHALREIGFVDGMYFVGEKELEDAFSDEVIAAALQNEFPREDGVEWQSAHIYVVRNNVLAEKPKFSEDLKNFVVTTAVRQKRNEVKKISIGRAIAKACAADSIPAEITAALAAVRQRAGIDN